MGEITQMPVSITALYAGLLALIFVALGINVTVHRVKLSVPLGDRGNSQMLRMMRLHGNAAEYIPLAVALMATYEPLIDVTRRSIEETAAAVLALLADRRRQMAS